MVAHCVKPLVVHKHCPAPEVDAELVQFWEKLDFKSRKALLTVDKKALFQRIRNQYCSRCFGLFVMRYDELKCSAQLDCPSESYSTFVVMLRAGLFHLDLLLSFMVIKTDLLACTAACQEFYAGLVCLDSGSLTLEEHVVLGQPFATFTESELRGARARVAIHDRRHLWQWMAEETWLVHVPSTHQSSPH